MASNDVSKTQKNCTHAKSAGISQDPANQMGGEAQKNGEVKRTYSKENIKIIKDIMEGATTALRGTCRRARIKGYRIMCKTGTANLLVNGKYSQDDNIFTCAGIIEKDDYQRVIVVFLKEIEKKGVHADTVAVPLFEKIAEKTLIHDKII